jgi:hypothetical protein
VGNWLRLYGPACLAWALTSFRLTSFRLADRRGWTRDPARRAVFVVVSALAASMTVNTPWMYDAVWRLTGVPNLARLLSHALMLVVAWGILTFVAHLSPSAGPPRWSWRESWRGLAWPALVLAGMCVAFALADTPVNDVRFAARYGGAPGVVEYWLLFMCYLVPALCRVIGFGLREAGQTPDAAVRVGLRLLAMGAAVTLLYHLHKAAYFACLRFGVGYPGVLRAPLDMLLTPSAAVLVLAGLSVPSWGRTRLGWLRDYRLHLRLRPLWRALYQANPDIALMVPASLLSEMLAFRDLDLRLYRRFVEIRDGRVALLPYLDPRVAGQAMRQGAGAGLRGLRLEAFAEAAVLDAALRARARGLPPAGEQHVSVPGGGDLGSDAAFLGLVSRAYRQRRHQD